MLISQLEKASIQVRKREEELTPFGLLLLLVVLIGSSIDDSCEAEKTEDFEIHSVVL